MSVARDEGPEPARILVVDDHENMCWIIRRILSERGHTVLTAQSGEQALHIARHLECQVAAVDYRLPDTTGLDLIAELRRRNAGLIAILMTSYGTPAVKERAASAGLFAFLDKPFKNALMVQSVERALASWRPGPVSREKGAASRKPISGSPKSGL